MNAFRPTSTISRQPRSSGRSLGNWLVILVPALWLVAFFAVPFLTVLKLSFSEAALALPPYVPVLDLSEGWTGLRDFVSGLTLDGYRLLFSDQLYWMSYLRSLTIALTSTAILLLIGYPLAYGIARAPRRVQPILMIGIILPFLTAFLIRIYAWMNILQRDGLLNELLLALGIVSTPPVWISTDPAIYIGMVYTYLPFMVLPLYASLERMDHTLLEAASDLGCPRWKSFWLVTVPLSGPGIVAGSLLCFIPIMGEFVIPDLLGGSHSMMIGQTVWLEFFDNRDWPVASALAIVMLLVLLVPILLYQRLQTREMAAEAAARTPRATAGPAQAGEAP